jgi:hypothetical protein
MKFDHAEDYRREGADKVRRTLLPKMKPLIFRLPGR